LRRHGWQKRETEPAKLDALERRMAAARQHPAARRHVRRLEVGASAGRNRHVARAFLHRSFRPTRSPLFGEWGVALPMGGKTAYGSRVPLVEGIGAKEGTVPDVFNFTRIDPRIVADLTTTEINGVTTWQSETLPYEFEFHTMHTIGYPVYLRESAINLKSNLPKIDTKDKTATTFNVVNREQINSQACLADFENVVRANFPLFQKLAKVYYDGKEVATTPTAPMLVFRCTKVATVKPMYVRIPKDKELMGEVWWANARQHAKAKPKCRKHNSSDCLDKGKIETVPVKEADRMYNHNFELVPV
jgi:hypothetical protein